MNAGMYVRAEHIGMQLDALLGCVAITMRVAADSGGLALRVSVLALRCISYRQWYAA